MRELLALADNREEYRLVMQFASIPGALTFTSIGNQEATRAVQAMLNMYRGLPE